MSDIKISSIPLNILFDNKRGNSAYTKKYCNAHKGNYTVYTGTTIGDFSKIATYDYETPNLTYTTDGVHAGTVELLTGKYNVGGHRAILIPKSDQLSLNYFSHILEPLFKSLIRDGSVPSVTWTRIKNVEIPVPVNDDGSYNFTAQEEVAQKYTQLEERKTELLEYRNQLFESYINITLTDYNYAEIPMNELFKYKRGRSCTKKYCNKYKGGNPVWSANNIKPLAYVDFYDYEGRYISLSRNGIAGKITILDGKFTINEDRFLLVPKVDNIDYEFIKYTVEPILRSKKKGRAGHSGQNEFTKLSFTILDNVKVRIPVNSDGSLNIHGQHEIAQKYKKIDEVKMSICDKIDTISSTNIKLADN